MKTPGYSTQLAELARRGIVVGAKVSYRSPIGLVHQGTIDSFYGKKSVIAIVSGTAMGAEMILGVV